MSTQIDFSRFTGNEEEIRQVDPKRELRSPAEKERTPDYYQRSQERDGHSEWSGGIMGGGMWAGRAR
jgi:hypothetical protein